MTARSLFLALLIPFASSAQDEEAAPGCNRFVEHPLPADAVPDAAAGKRLAGCDSVALLDAGEFAQARQCAYLERQAGDETVFGGSATLLTLYANGQGVERDFDLARRFACEAGGAPAEVEGRLEHLQAMQDSGDEDGRFDFCDDITSGYMTGFCADRDARKSAAARDEKWQALLATWSAADRAAWARLQTAAQAFFEARVEGEVDTSGTARGAFIVGEREALAEQLFDNVAAFERGELPDGTTDDLQAADAQLNTSYAVARKAAAPDNADDIFGPLGSISPDGIRDAERAWIKYRDAWVVFGAQRYPDVAAEAWLTYFTRERDKQLRELVEGY